MLQPLGQPHAAGADADQRHIGEILILDTFFEARRNIRYQRFDVELFEFVHGIQGGGRRRNLEDAWNLLVDGV